jgi:hypothetical protein
LLAGIPVDNKIVEVDRKEWAEGHVTFCPSHLLTAFR